MAPLTIAYKGDASRPFLPARALAQVLTVASEQDTRREDRLDAEENDDLTPSNTSSARGGSGKICYEKVQHCSHSDTSLFSPMVIAVVLEDCQLGRSLRETSW